MTFLRKTKNKTSKSQITCCVKVLRRFTLSGSGAEFRRDPQQTKQTEHRDLATQEEKMVTYKREMYYHRTHSCEQYFKEFGSCERILM